MLGLTIVAAVTFIAFVTAAVLYPGDEGSGDPSSAAIGLTSRPTQPPAAFTPRAVRPTAAPGAGITEAGSALAGTDAPSAGIVFWNKRTVKWQFAALQPRDSSYREGDTVPFLFRATGLEPGQVYELAIDYFDCGLSPERGFDGLASTEGLGDVHRLAAPAPGRARPDSRVLVPAGASGNIGGAAPYLAAWGATFQRAPELSPTTSTCAGDGSLNVTLRAQSSTIYVEWGGRLAEQAGRPGGGAASANAPFGMLAVFQGLPAARVEISPNAIAR